MSAKTLLALSGLVCLTAQAQAQSGRLFVGENGSDPNNLPYLFEADLDAGFPASVSWVPTFPFAIPSTGSPTGSHVPLSHTMTVPAPYCFGGIVPSNDP